MSDRVLGLFAKWPQPGTVKTRLGGGPEFGVRVARAFLLDTLSRLESIEARRVLAYSPPGTEDAFADLVRGRFLLEPQGDGDLGRRMANFIGRHLQSGAEAVVLVGADSPTLPVVHVESAFRHLQECEVVLGPAADGGYYLIGCRDRVPPIFDGIAWGCATVLTETIAFLNDPNWCVRLLPPWYDVDTPESWTMLRGHVAALRRSGHDPEVSHTEALLREAEP